MDAETEAMAALWCLPAVAPIPRPLAIQVTAGTVVEGRLAAAAAVMARLLTEARAYDDSPRRQGLVGRVTALIGELKSARWPPSVTVGGLSECMP